jgi:hypothetical protein
VRAALCEDVFSARSVIAPQKPEEALPRYLGRNGKASCFKQCRRDVLATDQLSGDGAGLKEEWLAWWLQVQKFAELSQWRGVVASLLHEVEAVGECDHPIFFEYGKLLQ